MTKHDGLVLVINPSDLNLAAKKQRRVFDANQDARIIQALPEAWSIRASPGTKNNCHPPDLELRTDHNAAGRLHPPRLRIL